MAAKKDLGLGGGGHGGGRGHGGSGVDIVTGCIFVILEAYLTTLFSHILKGRNKKGHVNR